MGRGFWENSRIGSTSNLSPNLHKKLHWHNVWFNCCGTLDSVEVLSLPRKTWVVKLRLNSALHTVAAAHLPPLPTWQEAVYMFLEQLTHCLWESDWGKSTLSFKYQGTVLRSIPFTIPTLSFSAISKNKNFWRLRLGYVGSFIGLWCRKYQKR